jgi:hypothetical protein
MSVPPFNATGTFLGAFDFWRDRTLISALGGTNSNSEGQFVFDAAPTTAVKSVLIQSFGDGFVAFSTFDWVTDNIDARPTSAPAPIPEPTVLVLICVGFGAIAAGRPQRRDGPE